MKLDISVLTCSHLLSITTDTANALCALFLTNEETEVQRLTEKLFQMNGDQPKQLISPMLVIFVGPKILKHYL